MYNILFKILNRLNDICILMFNIFNDNDINKIQSIINNLQNNEQKNNLQNYFTHLKQRLNSTDNSSAKTDLDWFKKIPEIRQGLTNRIPQTIDTTRKNEQKENFNRKILFQDELFDKIYQKFFDTEEPAAILFTGPPGIGKTQSASEFATVTNHKYDVIILTNITENDCLVSGNIPVYKRAEPGLLIQKILNNPEEKPLIIIFDEIGKARESVQNELLQILDTEKNDKIYDKFLKDIIFNLKNVKFICTSNTDDKIIEPLQTRLTTIQITELTLHQKYQYIKHKLEICNITNELSNNAFEYIVYGIDTIKQSYQIDDIDSEINKIELEIKDYKNKSKNIPIQLIINNISHRVEKIKSFNLNKTQNIREINVCIRDIQSYSINHTGKITDKFLQEKFNNNKYQIKSLYNDTNIIINLLMKNYTILFNIKEHKCIFDINDTGFYFSSKPEFDKSYFVLFFIIDKNNTIMYYSNVINFQTTCICPWNNFIKTSNINPKLERHIKEYNIEPYNETGLWCYQILLTTKNNILENLVTLDK